MKIEEFLDMFGGQTKDIKAVIDYVRQVRKVIDQNVQKYIRNIPENVQLLKTKIEFDPKKDKDEQLHDMMVTNIRYTDELNIGMIDQENTLRILTKLKEGNKYPFLFFVPDEFIRPTNQMEKLQEFGNALDKFLFQHWKFFRSYFDRKRSTVFDIIQIRDDIKECISPEKLNKICSRNSELLGHYLTYKQLMDDKMIGSYYQQKLKYEVSITAEYCSQIFQELKDSSPSAQMAVAQIVQETFEYVGNILIQFPQVLHETALKTIEYYLTYIDLQSYDISFKGPKNNILIAKYKQLFQQKMDDVSRRNLQDVIDMMERNDPREPYITQAVPVAIMTFFFDPMNNEKFKKLPKDEIDQKSKQFNDTLQSLPVWDILEKYKLKYYEYKVPSDKKQKKVRSVETLLNNSQLPPVSNFEQIKNYVDASGMPEFIQADLETENIIPESNVEEKHEAEQKIESEAEQKIESEAEQKIESEAEQKIERVVEHQDYDSVDDYLE